MLACHLNRGALVNAFECVEHFDIDLGSVEGTVSWIHPPMTLTFASHCIDQSVKLNILIMFSMPHSPANSSRASASCCSANCHS